ncbi:MAG: hypothetical protein ACUVWB_05340, partial [Anaerolineae bacterium]
MSADEHGPEHPRRRRLQRGVRWPLADAAAVLLAVLVLAWPAGGQPAESAPIPPAPWASAGFLPLFRAPFQWETTPPTPTLPPTDTPMPPTSTPRPTDTPVPVPTLTFTPAPRPTQTPTPAVIETPTLIP